MEDKKGICFEIFSNGVGVCLFGATGDLARKKIIPSLYNLYIKEYIRENFFILNIGSRDYDDKSFRNYIRDILKSKGYTDVDSFISRNFYFRIDYNSLNSYDLLKNKFLQIEKNYLQPDFKNTIFYLSIPPDSIKSVIYHIHKSFKFDTSMRIIIEKPYGSDFKKAIELNKFIKEINIEDNIYRIDHYLGKDSIINILLIRLVNILFDKTFNKDFIDNVQITIYEDEGVEDRISFYDNIGAFKDMITHILQIISFIAMELPDDIKQKEIKNRKVELLKNMVIPDKAGYFIRGRYSGYDKIGSVDVKKDTETFISFKLEFRNQRWNGVPFYVKCGKKMKEKITRVDIVYKPVESSFSRKYYIENPDILSFIIQPYKEMRLEFNAKSGGARFCIERHIWEDRFNYGVFSLSDYERLLLDAINKDKTLFLDSIEMECIWKYIDEIEKFIKENNIRTESYLPGFLPTGSIKMIEMDGRKWIYI